jgi:hypothetical protein
MKKSTRGAIYSLLICPGAGLWVLGEKKRALVFIIPTVIAAILLLMKIITIAQKEVNIMMETFSINFFLLYSKVHSQIYHDPSIRNILWFLLAAIILSSISSYFVGKKQEQEKA